MYKNIIIALLMVFTFGANGQYVDIPDYSFIRCFKENYPQLMNGDQLDVAAAEKYDGTLDLSKKRIRDLSGIENSKK